MRSMVHRKLSDNTALEAESALAIHREYLHNDSKSYTGGSHNKVIPVGEEGEGVDNNTDFSAILRNSGRWMMFSDFCAVITAFMAGGIFSAIINAFFLHNHFQPFASFDTFRQFLVFLVLGMAAMLWLDARGHYRQRLPFWETVGHMLVITIVGFVTCGFSEFFFQNVFSRLWLALGWFFFACFLFTGRIMVRKFLDRRGQWKIPVVIIGSRHSAESLVHALNLEPSMGFLIVEQVSSDNLDRLARPGAWRRLLEICEANHIFLALEGGEFERNKSAIRALVRERLPCSIVPPWLELPTGTLSQHHFLMHDLLLLHDTNRLLLPLPCFLKRGFDVICSAGALLLLSPVFIPVMIKVRQDGGPAFFSQPRVGRNGQVFFCYKFRSMRTDAEEFLKNHLQDNPKEAEEWKKFQKLKNDVRITAFGHFIRKTSIDELPQLINVLKGDMSLVGPRPIMVEQEEFYGDDFIYYKSVRPGITGPWQVSGRNRLTFSERVQLECSYARNWSLWLDIVILLKTLPALLKKDSVF